MPKKPVSRTKVVHYACAALMLVLLVLQFTPYWHYGEAGKAASSISSYIWFPTNHTDLTAHLQQLTGNPSFLVNNVLIPCLLMLLLSIAGTVLCILKPGSVWTSVVTAACGLSGVLGMMFKPALRLGSTWVLMLVLCLVLVTASVYVLLAGQSENPRA